MPEKKLDLKPLVEKVAPEEDAGRDQAAGDRKAGSAGESKPKERKTASPPEPKQEEKKQAKAAGEARCRSPSRKPIQSPKP